MGREMIKSSASDTLSQNPSDLDANSSELIGSEANLEYLCNLTPHRYAFLNSCHVYLLGMEHIMMILCELIYASLLSNYMLVLTLFNFEICTYTRVMYQSIQPPEHFGSSILL